MTINRRSLFGFFAAAPAMLAAASQPAAAAALTPFPAATWQLQVNTGGHITGVIIGDVEVQGSLVVDGSVFSTAPEPNQSLRDAAARYKALKS